MLLRDTVVNMLLAVKARAMRLYIAQGIKTVGTYQRQVWRLIRELYNGEIDEYQFIDDFSEFIDNQFGRAWRQGARDMGVNPNQFVDGDIDQLAVRIERERDFMLGLADDIMRARANKWPLEPFRQRSAMWAGRYDQVIQEAHIWFAGKRMLEWVYDPSKEHCDDCDRLNGVVASGNEWAASRWRPGARDLDCGGWRCGCRLLPTDKPPSPNGIPG